MFTGLVETTGSIANATHTSGALRLLIDAPGLEGRWRQGDSIAVNGVCLTALPTEDPKQFGADLAEETLRRTTLANLVPGAAVNLELPTPAGSPLGGHVVQGHVDGVARLIALEQLGPDPATADWRLKLELPPELARNVVQQGSLTVDGISLTVAKLQTESNGGSTVEIAVIPHTYASTHLRTLLPGAKVNIETDVLARYASKQAGQAAAEWLTSTYLLANGY